MTATDTAMTTSLDPDQASHLAKAVYETGSKKLNDPEWVPFPLRFSDGDFGLRSFEVLRALGYAREAGWEEDVNHDWAHPRAKEYLDRFGKPYIECLEVFLRLTNQPIEPIV